MSGERMQQFQRIVLKYYANHGRYDLPWRQPRSDGTFDPYFILVSEIMLQQTQVTRVLPKFIAFTTRFPTCDSLAAAPLGDVLKAWSGLGYNRRAKFLWQAAQIVSRRYHGELPQNSAELITLPGVGQNTAGALRAYAFNQPAVFIETNIRTVFIHHFFDDQTQVHDRDIVDLVARTLPDNPRQWYWALMDYGTHLKQTVGNTARSSAHYSKQSTFSGSRRQIRGQVLTMLREKQLSVAELTLAITDERLEAVLQDLQQEGLIIQDGTHYKL